MEKQEKIEEKILKLKSEFIDLAIKGKYSVPEIITFLGGLLIELSLTSGYTSEKFDNYLNLLKDARTDAESAANDETL